MSGTISLEFIGKALVAIQDEQRLMRAELRAIRHENNLLRPMIIDAITSLHDRIGNTEAFIEAKSAAQDGKLDRLASMFEAMQGDLTAIGAFIRGMKPEA